MPNFLSHCDLFPIRWWSGWVFLPLESAISVHVFWIYMNLYCIIWILIRSVEGIDQSSNHVDKSATVPCLCVEMMVLVQCQNMRCQTILLSYSFFFSFYIGFITASSKDPWLKDLRVGSLGCISRFFFHYSQLSLAVLGNASSIVLEIQFTGMRFLCISFFLLFWEINLWFLIFFWHCKD